MTQTRRSFLKTAGVAAVAASTGPSTAKTLAKASGTAAKPGVQRGENRLIAILLSTLAQIGGAKAFAG